MATPTQFRHYLISQDADGGNIEVARSADEVGVLAFDSLRLQFVHCHVLLEPLKNRGAFDSRARKLSESGHPLLARVLEFGEDEGSPYYITESVDGETLKSLIARHEELPVWLAVRLTDLALAAVEVLAGKGDFLPAQPLEALRVVQVGPESLRVVVADYRLADSAAVRPARRVVRAEFEKKSRFLSAYFAERFESGKAGATDAQLGAADFSELLHHVLQCCGPETRDAIMELRGALRGSPAASAGGVMAANSRPRPLLAPLLASFQEVARSVSQTMRMQSQRLDAGQPYALRATLLRSGQAIMVEQIPPARLAGVAAAEALRQSLHPPKPGKFPNLVPLVHVGENDGIECMAEVAVEGVTLAELLAARGVLEPQEVFLVLTGVDAAISQLEKAARAVRRLRLEDIFLFTGIGKENPRVAGLLGEKLHRWPGFSIVLRGHPCLHSMSGRGVDPARLLPVEARVRGDAEPLWNGGWMAALGACLAGAREGARTAAGKAGAELVERLLHDELANARKGAPSSRAAFLARFSKVLREHDLEVVGSGGVWHGPGGALGAAAPAVDVARLAVETAPARLPPRKVAAAPPPPPPEPEGEEVAIGFAEALIRPPAPRGAGKGAETEDPLPPVESSWTGFRERKPLWMRVTTLVGMAMAVGAALAHLQGRALWQRGPETPPEPRAEESGLPSPPVPAPAELASSGAQSVKPPGAAETAPATALRLAPPDKPLVPGVNLDPVPKRAALAPEVLALRLRELRESGAKLPEDLRADTEEAARRGMTEAMIALGGALLRGDHGTIDERAAFTWLDKAFQGGDAGAIVPLAGCYLQGWGVAPDFARAVSLLNRGAAEGNGPAKDLLGVCYARGLGIARDDQKAFQLCSEAYSAGVPSACGNLGAMYLRGQGVAADPARAVALFAEGSRKGHAESMLLYAQCLETGSGVTADAVQAGEWYRQAARLGNAEAVAWCRRAGLAF